MNDPVSLLQDYYPPTTRAYRILYEHSCQVAERAVAIATRLKKHHTALDLEFIYEAAMLHDIGIFRVYAPSLGCFGQLSYLHHGVEGAQILINEGLPRHAGVSERHTGVGLTALEIVQNKLGLPVRDMVPQTLEEQIIAYADLFYSKNPKKRHHERSVQRIRHSLCQFGNEKGCIFDRWHEQFQDRAEQ